MISFIDKKLSIEWLTSKNLILNCDIIPNNEYPLRIKNKLPLQYIILKAQENTNKYEVIEGQEEIVGLLNYLKTDYNKLNIMEQRKFKNKRVPIYILTKDSERIGW